jgi:hypothetical protein
MEPRHDRGRRLDQPRRDRPSDPGLAPYGGVVQTRKPAPPGSAIAVLEDVARTGTFWGLAASFFVCGATTRAG